MERRLFNRQLLSYERMRSERERDKTDTQLSRTMSSSSNDKSDEDLCGFRARACSANPCTVSRDFLHFINKVLTVFSLLCKYR